jgi:O-antigen/teichoic acid export membrane protein
MKRPDAARTFSRVTTYGFTFLVLLTAGLSAIAQDIVRLVTPPAFHPAAQFVPWIAIGVTLQGIYLLTSIGMNITKQTHLYPIATGAAAATSVAANLLLIPRVGTIGAAWANVLAYGVLAAVSFQFSRRLFPIPYEWRRLTHALVAGVLVYGAAQTVPAGWAPWLGVLVRGSVVVVGFFGVLLATGFLYADERAALRKRLRPGADPVTDAKPAAAPVNPSPRESGR